MIGGLLILIEEILKKAERNKKIDDEEFLQLFFIEDKEDLDKLYQSAVRIRNKNLKEIKLTSTVHITNKCQVKPRCHYCGFAVNTSRDGYYEGFFKSDDEIRDAV